MSQIGEKTAITADGPEEPTDEKTVSIRFCVFFDGTLNNRTNIEQRLTAVPDNELTDEERKEAEVLKKKLAEQKANEDMLLAKPAKELTTNEITQVKAIQKERALGTPEELYKKYRAKRDKKTGEATEDNSYDSYYTNVVKMDRHVNTDEGKTPNYQLTLKTYIEGSGTLIKKGDRMNGYALAMGESGVPEKVEKGMRTVLAKIRMEQPDVKVTIKKLTLDVFGFSRGAAAARNFINDALNGRKTVSEGTTLPSNDETTSIKALLESKGYTINDVNVCFAGLYDTVSTYGLGVISDALGITNDAANNVETLSLKAVAQAEETVHLAAADEHRFHFSLTNISSAGANGLEVFLPGVHSDIGGGYRDAVTESLILRGSHDLSGIILHGNYPSVDEANKDRAQLIAAGWYQEDEIFVEPVLSKNSEGEEEVIWATLRVHRSGKKPVGISNTYSRIPLHIMVKKARNKQIVFKDKLDRDEAVPAELSTIQDDIQSYVDSKGSSSQASDWFGTTQYSWLSKLRHDYLHFSARMSLGHDPRFKDKQRTRMTYHG